MVITCRDLNMLYCFSKKSKNTCVSNTIPQPWHILWTTWTCPCYFAGMIISDILRATIEFSKCFANRAVEITRYKILITVVSPWWLLMAWRNGEACLHHQCWAIPWICVMNYKDSVQLNFCAENHPSGEPVAERTRIYLLVVCRYVCWVVCFKGYFNYNNSSFMAADGLAHWSGLITGQTA